MAVKLPGYWQDLTSPEFKELDAARTVAVLPVGAIEQHGPHLAVATDAALNEAILRRALETAPDGLPVLALPMTSVGKSEEHLDYPGTLTLSAETLTAVWSEIGAGVARAGIRKLLIFNSHGGQPQVMQIVARRLRVEHAMFTVAANWFAWGTPEGLFGEVERRHGIHAGEVETSMMLACRPDLVRRQHVADFPPVTIEQVRDYPRLAALGGAGFGWQAQDLHPQGAAGDARAASAEKGRAVIEHAARCLVELLEEIVRYPLEMVRPAP